MTKRVEALQREIIENGLVFDLRTDANADGGGKVQRIPLPSTTAAMSSRRRM